MRHDSPYLVKRWAPTFGRPAEPRRVTVAYQEYSIAAAVTHARSALQASRRLGSYQSEAFGHNLAAYWIERRGQPATLTTRARRNRGAGLPLVDGQAGAGDGGSE